MSEELMDLYLNTHIGIALEETLNKLYESGEINKDIKVEFMNCFQEILMSTIDEESKKHYSIKGYLDTYQNTDNDWKFWVKDAIISSDSNTISVSVLKIVAVSEDHKKAEIARIGPHKKRKIEEEID